MAHNKHYKILPSLLSANIINLQEEISNIIAAQADMLHIDVMDNHYVPNLTFGPMLCQAIYQKFDQIPLDVHLMVSPTDALIQQFANSHASRISIHPGATNHLDRSLQLIKSFKIKAGVALNPSDSPDIIKWCQNRIDFVLVMTVNPGFGGQTLIEHVIEKILFIHKNYPELPICVDGGVNVNNIKKLANAGCQEFVAGSAIFNSDSYKNTINQMREQLQTV